MKGTSSLFCCFLSKIRTTGEISDRIWAKTQHSTVTIFTKSNVFYERYSQNVDFTHKLKKIIFFRQLTGVPAYRLSHTWTSCLFCCYLSKNRRKGEISDRIWAKTPYNKVTFFFKDDTPRIKNVTFWKNCRLRICGFCSNSVWNLNFLFYFFTKRSKIKTMYLA